MTLKFEKKGDKKGFAAIFMIILVIAIMLGIGLSAINLILSEQEISKNMIKSTQAYYAAESGIEDALLRLEKGMSFTNPYLMNMENGSTTIVISDVIGGARTITASSSVSGRIRKIQVVRQISMTNAKFFYGAQAGDGGLIMANNSKVHGNIFSNGDIGDDKGYVDNDVIVSGHHQINISGGSIGGDALVYDCTAGNITGKLTYVNSNSCTVGGGTQQQTDEINPVPLPLAQSKIEEWIIEAAAGGVTTADVTIDGTQSLGAIQIGTSGAPKNLTVNGTLNITGTIYVTGNITFNGITRLDSLYGSDSGIIFASGTIYVANGAIISGSGQAGSYTLVLSTNNSLDPVTPAINVRNNAGGSIFYTTAGLIYLKNNMSAREITGYKIQIESNAEIWYESGLSDLRFSGGPGGSWEIISWKEIE
jgi:hypothetical protein